MVDEKDRKDDDPKQSRKFIKTAKDVDIEDREEVFERALAAIQENAKTKKKSE